jgi:hypothetical protein
MAQEGTLLVLQSAVSFAMHAAEQESRHANDYNKLF